MDRLFKTRRGRVVAVVMTAALTFGLAGCIGGGPPPGSSPVPCAFPNVNSWNSFQTQFTRGLRPAANWVVSDSQNASIISEPLGRASTSLGFAPNTFTGFTHPDQVITNLLINPPFGPPSITNIQIINATGTYAANGGIQRDYEFVGTNSFELSSPGTAVHGWYTALVTGGQDSFWATYMEIAHSNIWDFVCGSLFAIRAFLSRIPVAPTPNPGTLAVEETLGAMAQQLPEGIG